MAKDIARPASTMFVASNILNDESAVTCPVCGYHQIHMSTVDISFDGSVLHVDGRRTRRALAERSIAHRDGLVVMYFSGECSHEWLLLLGEHKGQVYSEILILDEM